MLEGAAGAARTAAVAAVAVAAEEVGAGCGCAVDLDVPEGARRIHARALQKGAAHLGRVCVGVVRRRRRSRSKRRRGQVRCGVLV